VALVIAGDLQGVGLVSAQDGEEVLCAAAGGLAVVAGEYPTELQARGRGDRLGSDGGQGL
jgi:hypothetical protein